MKKKQKKKQGLARLFALTKDKKKYLNLAMITTCTSALLRLVQFWLLYQIIIELISNAFVIEKININAIQTLSFAMVISGMLYGVLRYIASRFAHSAAFSIIYNLKLKLVEHLNCIPIGQFNEMTLGEMDKIIMNDTEKIEQFISHHQMDLIETLLMMPIIILYLFTVDSMMTVLAVVPLVFAVVILAMTMSRADNKADQVILHDKIGLMQTEVIEYIEGMNDIKCYDIGKSAMGKYRQGIQDLADIIMKIAKKFASKIGFFYALLVAPLMFIFPLVIYRYYHSEDTTSLLSVYLLFVMVVPLIKDYLEKYFTMSRSMQEITEGVKRIDDILEIPILEEPDNSKVPQHFDIHFDNISFSYGDKQVLNNINFHIKQGRKLAIIGASGGGKTTIAKILLKFLRPQSGEVYLGGIPFSEISSTELMHHVSFVFQESYLFKDTILFNLTMGKEVDIKRVTDVCKALNLDEKITSLKEGYHTQVGKGEGFFSGGEIQRLAVARILLKESKIIVLDEATASADTENEKFLQRAFQQLASDKTVVVIAHRLKTIEGVDEILVVENGEIVERGTHHTLLTSKGRYFKLHQLTQESEVLSLDGRSASC